jgi:glutathione synthase/RimK-type ligase-like ATP-grasp enzyme
MNKKKICIFIPKGKNGFFNDNIVNEIEEKLYNDQEVEFLGNVNLENASIIDGKVLCDDVNISDSDLFFWYAKGMKKYEDILFAISLHAKVIKNPKSLAVVGDKFKAHTLLSAAGFDVSQNALVRYDDFEMMKTILDDWGTVLIKPRSGSYGRGIIKTNDFEILRDVAGILELQTKNKYIFVEKFYPHTMSDWMSVVVVNFKAIYGYRKKENKFANWKVYDLHKEGGNAVEADISEVQNMAEKAAQVIEEQVICFDILKTKQGYKIIDENNFPGLYEEILKKHQLTLPVLFIDIIKNICKSSHT